VAIRHPGNSWPRSACRPARAFTLTELLVVIGITAVLLALLLPVLSKARASGQSVACLSNLRQIMMAFHLYAGDNAQRLPDPVAAQQSWESLLKQYLPSRESYHCPSDGGLFENLRSSYDWRDTAEANTTVAGKAVADVRRTDTVIAFDALPDWHGKGRINSAQIDGSARNMSYQECLQDLEKDP
jgi:prepilin-type N-terminal cleavage/methylation domain-containing protein